MAVALAAFGAGSMAAALALPRLLERVSDRGAMVAAGLLLTLLTLGQAAWWLARGLPGWPAFLAAWAVSGLLYSTILTPAGRLLRRSTHAEDRPAIFAAQFALSHACWLVTYPVAGWAGEALGLPLAMLALGGLALAGLAASVAVWPRGDPRELVHEHPDLEASHQHLREHAGDGRRHRHVFVIDENHPHWPRPA